MRRLRALACHGWSLYEIVRVMGEPGLRCQFDEIRGGKRRHVRAETARRINAFYAQYALDICLHPSANRVRRLARRRGWIGPLGWDDIDQGILD